VATYFAGLAVFISYNAIEKISEIESDIRLEVGVLAWILVLLFQSQPSNLISYLAAPNMESDKLRNGFSAESWLISEMNFSSKDSVWIISQHTVGYEFYMFQYEILPASVGKIPFSIGSRSGEGDIWTDPSYTQSRWESALTEYDYVFLQKITESFTNEFSSIFEEPSDISAPSIYKVNHKPSGNTLEKVR
jgi:hypothetical protein